MSIKNGKLYIKQDVNSDNVTVTSIKDSEGNTLNVTDSHDKNSLPKKILVTVEATHTGVNRNLVEYTSDGLEKSTASWTNNYNKPVLLNHDSWSDPLGRVLGADFKDSVINPNKQCIQLTLEITNQAAIERFLDGRYKTFSIGGYTDSAVCSVCGKDVMKHGFCGHHRGRKYDGKDCYWTLGQMDYDEISVVNSPADVHAQAIDIKIIGEDGKAKDFYTVEPQVTDSTDNPLDNIDSALGLTDNTEPEQNNIKDNVSSSDENSSDEGNTNENNSDEGDSDGNIVDAGEGDKQEETVLKSEYDKLQQTLTEVQDKFDALQQDHLTLQGSIEAKNIELDEVVAERDTLKTDNENLSKQNLSLAKYSHRLMAERVADMQILSGIKKLEERENCVKEYSTFTSKKLDEMLKDNLTINKVHNSIVKASNPSIANNDDSVDENKQVKLSLADYENKIIKGITNNGIGGIY